MIDEANHLQKTLERLFPDTSALLIATDYYDAIKPDKPESVIAYYETTLNFDINDLRFILDKLALQEHRKYLQQAIDKGENGS